MQSPRQKKISIDDIAAITGVSRGTVSRAFNQRSDISKATRTLILETAKKLNYLPNSSARGLAKGRSECIGIVVPDIRNPFLAEMVTILEEIINARGLSVILSLVGDDVERQQKVLMHMASGAVDGIIITPCEAPESVDQLNWINSRTPVVALKNLEKLECDTVVSNDRASIGLIVRHLLERGHKKLALVTPTRPEWTVALRKQAFLDALAQAKITDPICVEFENSPLDGKEEAAMQRLTDQVLKTIEEKKIDAILAYDDIIAMNLIKFLTVRGKHVPTDVAVAGIDNISFGHLGLVPLTSAAADLRRLCESAADILEERIVSGKCDEVRNIVLKPTLYVRSSTGEAPKK